MKPFQYTTPTPVTPSLADMRRWPLVLYQLHARLAPSFARPEPYQHALLYLHAVISEIPRKNGWQRASHAQQRHPSGMQRLLSRAAWDQVGVCHELRTFVAQTLLPADSPSSSSPNPVTVPGAVLVVDAQRLSQTWQPLSRGAAAVLRSQRTHRELPGGRLPLLRHGPRSYPHRPRTLPARSLVPRSPTPAGRSYSRPPHLSHQTRTGQRHDPARPGQRSAHRLGSGRYRSQATAPTCAPGSRRKASPPRLPVPCTEVVCVATPHGERLGTVAELAHELVRHEDWQRLSQSQGTKGPRLFDWAILPLVEGGCVDQRHWLVCRRCLDPPHDMAYYLVWAPLATPLPVLVTVIGGRWHIEEDLETAKDLGLDQYARPQLCRLVSPSHPRPAGLRLPAAPLAPADFPC